MKENSESSDWKSQDKLDIEKDKLEIKKLRFEIKELQDRNSWHVIVTRYVPVAMAIIAVFALWFNIRKFVTEQEGSNFQSREKKFFNNLEELLKYPGNKSHSVSRAAFLFKQLDFLTRDSQRLPRNDVTDAVVEIVMKDLDFTQLRDVRFDIAAMHYWKDYRCHLRLRLDRQRLIMYRYT